MDGEWFDKSRFFSYRIEYKKYTNFSYSFDNLSNDFGKKNYFTYSKNITSLDEINNELINEMLDDKNQTL